MTVINLFGVGVGFFLFFCIMIYLFFCFPQNNRNEWWLTSADFQKVSIRFVQNGTTLWTGRDRYQLFPGEKENTNNWRPRWQIWGSDARGIRSVHVNSTWIEERCLWLVIHLIHKYWVIFVPSLFYSTTSLATCFVLFIKQFWLFDRFWYRGFRPSGFPWRWSRGFN